MAKKKIKERLNFTNDKLESDKEDREGLGHGRRKGTKEQREDKLGVKKTKKTREMEKVKGKTRIQEMQRKERTIEDTDAEIKRKREIEKVKTT